MLTKPKITQLQWVKDKLKKDGFITRNECLSNYISRLGAIISVLKEQGYEFEAGYFKLETMFGISKDYKYTLKDIK